MQIDLNINQNIREQFEDQFKLREVQGEYFLDSAFGGGGGMKFVDFPGQMEFYHFQKSYFKIPIQMKSTNPVDSEWFLIHINLSKSKQVKTTQGRRIEFQKHLPIGLLLYGPGLEIGTTLPPHIEMELASIHFSHSFLDTYFDDWKSHIDISKNLVYEDLDFRLESALNEALLTMENKLMCHANVLHFMNLFMEKIKDHSKMVHHRTLHSEDVQNLFLASTLLRDPLSKTIPSVGELAATAKMSKTKFKALFRQLFGSAPFQYRNKIRMEYAREELHVNRKSPTEVSFVLGYAHPSSFTVAYKKYFGELPSSRGK